MTLYNKHLVGNESMVLITIVGLVSLVAKV